MNDVNSILSYALRHKEGFSSSIDKEGNIEVLSKLDWCNKFIVAHDSFITINNASRFFNKGKGFTVTYDPNNIYESKLRAHFKEQLIGGWYDKDNDTYLIEVIQTFDNFKEALVYGKIYKQRFIYEYSTGDCIPVIQSDNKHAIEEGNKKLKELKKWLQDDKENLDKIQAKYYNIVHDSTIVNSVCLNIIEYDFKLQWIEIKKLSRRIVLLTDTLKDLQEES